MGLFGILETEDLVQELDKTRLDASKSFASGTTPITVVEIKPTKLSSYIDVTNALAADSQYLDWMFDFKIEIDAENNKLDFKEGAISKVATLANGSYTLAALATEIGTKMTTAGTQTYTATVSATNAFTISAASAFGLLLATGANDSVSIFDDIGFTGPDLAAAVSHQGDNVERIEAKVTTKITNATTNVTKSKIVYVMSELADALWSNDRMLIAHEFDIMRYLPAGRATWKHIHRQAQTLILAWLDKEGFVDAFREKLTKANFVLPEELEQWSTHIALRLIFEGISNAKDDVFRDKAKEYKGLEVVYRERAVLRLDLDGDGEAQSGEESDIRSCVVVRR
jgi:hypothetical protein